MCHTQWYFTFTQKPQHHEYLSQVLLSSRRLHFSLSKWKAEQLVFIYCICRRHLKRLALTVEEEFCPSKVAGRFPKEYRSSCLPQGLFPEVSVTCVPPQVPRMCWSRRVLLRSGACGGTAIGRAASRPQKLASLGFRGWESEARAAAWLVPGRVCFQVGRLTSPRVLGGREQRECKLPGPLSTSLSPVTLIQS
ncbi:hypothetical protein HJG60_008534 [Phyllostomus discolor]|uniref:Uncharacterized protein n=1 Tax=Phyllostomus discolor TaxID=89673 RepID=A0A833YXU1_9CHIR|nr:hypothetical protein HJG60_008534 [Phyllostomus discolor]